MNVPTYSGD